MIYYKFHKETDVRKLKIIVDEKKAKCLNPRAIIKGEGRGKKGEFFSGWGPFAGRQSHVSMYRGFLFSPLLGALHNYTTSRDIISCSRTNGSEVP